MNFLKPKSHYIKTALSLSCQQLYQETLEYYYGKNTFYLPVSDPFAISCWRFHPRHFNLIKVLRLEAKTFFWSPSSDSVMTSAHTKRCRQRIAKYLRAIFWVDQASLAPNLKTLIFAERMPNEDTICDWDQRIDLSKERVEGYIQVFERFQIGVGKVRLILKKDQFHGLDNESEVLDWLFK